MALLMFCQSFFISTFLSYADVIFTNSLKVLIKEDAPAVNPQMVIDAGATAFRSVVPETDLSAVLAAYSKSVNYVFYLAVGASGLAFLFSFGLGWKDIRKKSKPNPPGKETA
jgi:hypothetical protein